jgi:hypothetical protein
MERLIKVATNVKQLIPGKPSRIICVRKEVINMAVQTISPAHFNEQTKRWEYASLMTELVLGWGSVILSVLGILGLFPTYLAEITVIVLGVVLLFSKPERCLAI